MKRKCLAVGIILLFIGTCIIPAIAQNIEKTLPTSRGNWLYVGGSGPGNYTKIQDAIDNASDGDTVFVFDDSSPYCEEIEIRKSINLIGENHNTVIDGMNEMAHCITIWADYVTISCFSIINFLRGMYVSGDNAVISNILFTNNNLCGVSLIFTKNSIVSNNIFKNSRIGLELAESSNNLISQNEITGCEDGIHFYIPASDNTIINNEITKNVNGIYFKAFDWEYKAYIIENTIVQYNNITDNSIGINIFGKFKNGVIENNNFIENDISFFYKIFLGQRLKINANFWREIKLLPKVIPGLALIYLFTNNVNPKNPFDVFLYIPKIIFDWHPAQEPYDITGMT